MGVALPTPPITNTSSLWPGHYRGDASAFAACLPRPPRHQAAARCRSGRRTWRSRSLRPPRTPLPCSQIWHKDARAGPPRRVPKHIRTPEKAVRAPTTLPRNRLPFVVRDLGTFSNPKDAARPDARLSRDLPRVVPACVSTTQGERQGDGALTLAPSFLSCYVLKLGLKVARGTGLALHRVQSYRIG